MLLTRNVSITQLRREVATTLPCREDILYILWGIVVVVIMWEKMVEKMSRIVGYWKENSLVNLTKKLVFLGNKYDAPLSPSTTLFWRRLAQKTHAYTCIRAWQFCSITSFRLRPWKFCDLEECDSHDLFSELNNAAIFILKSSLVEAECERKAKECDL